MTARIVLGLSMILGGCALLRESLSLQLERASTPLYPFPSPPIVPAAIEVAPGASPAAPEVPTLENAPR